MKRMAIRKKTSFLSKKLMLFGIFFFFCLFLPLLSDFLPQISTSLRLSHIPALLCGFLCGPYYGFIVGFLSSIVYGWFFSDLLFPDYFSIAVELASYGAMAGFMYHMLPKKLESIYTSLVISMITGRTLWGVSHLIFSCFGEQILTLDVFLDQSIFSCVPGICLSLIFVPLIVLAVQQASFINR